MSITIYRDNDAKAIFIEDANGAQFLNSLHATINSGLVSVADIAKGFELVSEVDYAEIIDSNGVGYGADAVEVVDALNVLFQTSGSTGEVPIITSNTSINVTEGDTINYELTADYGVGYEWGSLPSGVTTVDGNIRKLIGGSGLSAGIYTPTVKAINYFGEDQETITINVANPPFSNSKSVQFQNSDWLNNSSVSSMSGTLGRVSNGSGASDAWTISFYLKPGTHTGVSKQTIFYYGDSDHDNGGHIWVYYKGSEQAIYMEYGSKNNYIRLKTANSTLSVGSWANIILTYDGGTTGSSSGSISNYYSRFEIFVDGASQSVTNSNGNFGWSSGVDSDLIRLGRRASGNDYMKNSTKLDEVAVWGSDETANVASIYNSGDPLDLSTLGSAPSNWWRMGDGDTFPTLADNVGSIDLTMNNMTVADIVNDVP
jgi:hypothetical protein